MAQTAPTPSETPRPLPRRTRVPAPRTTRPRLTPVDGVWMAALAALSAFPSLRAPHASALSGVTVAATVVLVYLLGWRARDRAAGVIAASLLALSFPYAAGAAAVPLTALFTLLTVGALFAFVAGSSSVALVLALLAYLLRYDGAVLGLLLAALSLAQARKRSVLGATLFFVTAAAAWVVKIIYLHQWHGVPHLSANLSSLTWTLTLPTVFLTWFLLPFLGELGEAPRRARWLPIVLWVILFLALTSFVRFGSDTEALLPFMPLLFVLAAGGLSRLLPTLAGEFPNPLLRYVVATLAVLSLLGIRAWSEWPSTRPAPMPAPAAVVIPPRPMPVPAAPPPPVHRLSPPDSAALKPATKHAIPAKPAAKHPAPAAKRAAAKKSPAKPAVPQYVWKNGRLVHRTKWAIQWDLTHPRH